MPLIYFSLLGLVFALALWRGRRDERIVASTAVLASIASLLLLRHRADIYLGIETSVLLVDLSVLVVFVWVALASKRFWPLWVAGLQLTTMFAHVMKAVNVDLMPTAYAVAAQFWVYPILLILLIGTLRTPRATRHAAGTPSANAAA